MKVGILPAWTIFLTAMPVPGARGPDNGGHLVLVDELFGNVHGFGRIALGIADNQFNRFAIDPASLLILSTTMSATSLVGGADKRGRTGQVEKSTDLDRIPGSSTAPGKHYHHSYG